MNDMVIQLVSEFRGVWRRRWIGLGVAWLVAGVGAVALTRIQDRYEALARVYVDTQSVLKPLMQGMTVEPNVDQQVAMLSRTLISRPNVSRLIEMTGLDSGGRSNEALVDDLVRRLQIAGAGRDNRENIYTLTFTDADPETAKRVIESLSRIFVESSRGQSRQDSSDAKAFIEEQIKVYEGKLEEAENGLKSFRLRYVGLPGVGQDLTGSINEANSRLVEARLQLREAENARDSLKRQLSGEDVVLANPGSAVPEIDARIDALKRNLDTLMQRYTEEHPDVVGAKRVLVQLEEQRRQELAVQQRASVRRTVTSDNANPVYQELKVSLARADANVATMQTRVAEYEMRYRQLKESARVMPEIQAELAKLNRDYEINKRNYESLVARRESAQLSKDMGVADGVAEFRLVEPPRVSSTPVAPNRRLLLPIFLLAAVGAGALASFWANRILPVFFDNRELRDITGLPVLGGVSYKATACSSRRDRFRFVGFLAGVGSLVAAYGVGMAFLIMSSARPV